MSQFARQDVDMLLRSNVGLSVLMTCTTSFATACFHMLHYRPGQMIMADIQRYIDNWYQFFTCTLYPKMH